MGGELSKNNIYLVWYQQHVTSFFRRSLSWVFRRSLSLSFFYGFPALACAAVCVLFVCLVSFSSGPFVFSHRLVWNCYCFCCCRRSIFDEMRLFVLPCLAFFVWPIHRSRKLPRGVIWFGYWSWVYCWNQRVFDHVLGSGGIEKVNFTALTPLPSPPRIWCNEWYNREIMTIYHTR